MIAPIIIDENVVLHPVSVDDAPELCQAVDRSYERLRQWLPWVAPDYGLEDAVRFLAERVEENSGELALTMSIRNRQRLCGMIGMHRFDLANRFSSIGYWIDSESEGRGIVTRSCRALVDAGFRQYGLHRIEIRCATGNSRSCAVPRRLGFVEEGILRDAQWVNGHWVDLKVFSKLETEWS